MPMHGSAEVGNQVSDVYYHLVALAGVSKTAGESRRKHAILGC